ncbi:MAG: protein-methionine-sulfoxide reductase catalytic subunit MsrP [Pseudomonadales bacterium]
MSKRFHRSQSPAIKSSEITSETAFVNRRELLKLGAGQALGLGLVGTAAARADVSKPTVSKVTTARYNTDEALTPEDIITSYNNFYEFGLDKTDPAKHAHKMTTEPWTVEVAGAAAKTGIFDLQDVLKGLTVEERIYRMRCVEAWSMVIPWNGVPLASVLKQFEPDSDARYVEFTTLKRPSEMRGQRSLFSSIKWPYVEALRMDEAMHPLTLMATGLYGKKLQNQNGAPWRLVVPWKYGFKSGKSIVKIRFTKREPRNTWNILAPSEYGFYANVNPAVAHPRWSQATERRLPSQLFSPNRIATLPFNGYGNEVADLYAGMDLTRNF